MCLCLYTSTNCCTQFSDMNAHTNNASVVLLHAFEGGGYLAAVTCFFFDQNPPHLRPPGAARRVLGEGDYRCLPRKAGGGVNFPLFLPQSHSGPPKSVVFLEKKFLKKSGWKWLSVTLDVPFARRKSYVCCFIFSLKIQDFGEKSRLCPFFGRFFFGLKIAKSGPGSQAGWGGGQKIWPQNHPGPPKKCFLDRKKLV